VCAALQENCVGPGEVCEEKIHGMIKKHPGLLQTGLNRYFKQL